MRRKQNISRAAGYCIMLSAVLGAALLLVGYIAKSQKEKQDQQIIASYDQDAVDGKVPMPVTPDAVRVIRKESGGSPTMVDVVIKSGETNRFDLIAPADKSSTNWHFK